MEENKSKSKAGISIAMILLAIVIGFGFVIGLTQTSGANNLNTKNSEFSNYSFDESGTLLAYIGDKTEVEIPATYSLSSQVENVEMNSSSVYTLIDKANRLGIKSYSIENKTGNYQDDWGNTYYQELYTLSYKKRQVIEGTDYTVKTIGSGAFQNNVNITSVVIPNTVTTIGDNAFAGCTKLAHVNMPEDLQRIENAAFMNCQKLQNIELPDTVQYIGGQAFQNCDTFTTINIPTGISEIYDMTFYNCDNLFTVEIPSNVRMIYSQAFYYCRNLTNLTLHEGLERIENSAFYNCRALTNVSLPSTLYYLGSNSFYNCPLLSTVYLNNEWNVPDMSGLAFSNAYIQRIYVNDSIYDQIINYGNWANYSSKIYKLSEI